MQGKFSDTSYFLIKDFFDEIKNSKYEDKPITDYKWDVTFVSTLVNGSSISFSDEPYDFLNSGSEVNIIFTNHTLNIFNLIYYYDPNVVRTNNSYIISPFINITTNGNGIVDLYVKEYDDGYIPISLQHINTKGDRFNFYSNAGHTLQPGDTIISTLQGNSYKFDIYDTFIDLKPSNYFDNNRETYWRKDSLFHEWLLKYANTYYKDKWGVDLNIRNYVNTDKIFCLFHKIFKSHDSLECRIIFYGMKNFVMDAIPEHQRTPIFKKFMDIYFDELYQENYNLIKNIWSLNDAMEVDRKYIGYLSKFYDMFDVDKINIPDLHLREFVRDMIWILKRKGTYTDFFILWRILTNTKNRLNIYERWHLRNTAQFPEWPDSIDPYDITTWPEWPYHYTHNDNFKIQSIPSSAWVVSKDADMVETNIQTFDINLNEIVPSSITYNDNEIFINFDELTTGFIIIDKPNETQSTHYDIDTWVIHHSSNQKEVIVNFNDDKSKIYEGSTTLVNTDTLYSLFSPEEIINITERNANISIGNYVHIQDTPELVWNINHNMITKSILISVYTPDNNRLIQSEYSIVDHRNISITFDEPQDGYVVLVRVDKDFNGDVHVPPSAWHDTIYTMKPEYEQPIISGGAGPLWYKNNYPMTLEACMSDMGAEVIYIREDAYVYTKYKVETNIWEIDHNLGNKNVLVQTFDDMLNEIYPTEMVFDNDNHVTIIFPYDVRGFAFIKKDDLSVDKTIFAGSEWDIYHAFDNQDVIINFSNNDKRLVAKDVWLKNEDHVIAYETVNSNIFTQAIPDGLWVITHNIGAEVMVSIFNEDVEELIPSEIVHFSENMVYVYFDEPTTGYAIVKKVDEFKIQENIDLIWTVRNDLNQKELIIDFRDNNRSIFESSLELIDDEFSAGTFENPDLKSAGIIKGNVLWVQSTPATTWNIYHNLNSKSVIVSVYSTEDKRMVPSDYKIINDGNIQLYFDEITDGYVVLTVTDDIDNSNRLQKAFMLSADFKFEQHDPSIEWRIPYTEEIKGFIANVYSWDDIKMNPAEYNTLTDGDYVTVKFRNPTSGYVLLEEICDFIDIRKDKKMMLSTHYIVELDINDEPMDYHSVLSKQTWENISVYWEYLRPVNRVSEYRIVLSPITNFSNKFISLYGDHTANSDAYVLSQNQYFSGIEQGAYIYSQTTPETEWYINHNLGANVHVQIFNDDFNEIIPYEIVFDSLSVMRILFRTPTTGFAMMKKAKEYRIQDPITNIWNIGNNLNQKELVINFSEDKHKVYEKSLTMIDFSTSTATFSDPIVRDIMISNIDEKFTQTTPENIWTVTHTLDTSSVLITVYDENNRKIAPIDYKIIDNFTIHLNFEIPESGYVVIMRSFAYNFTNSINWFVEHNLDNYVNVQVYDDTMTQTMPSYIYKTLDNIRAVFEEPQSGYININVSEEYYKQDNDLKEWTVDTTIGSQDAITNIFENGEQVNEGSVTLTDNDTIDVTFSTTVGANDLLIRDEVTSDGNYIFFQNTPSKIWDVDHNIGARGWVSNVYGSDDERIHPSEYKLIDASNLIIEFNKEVDGYVVLLKIGNLTLDGFDFEDSVLKLYGTEGDIYNNIDPIYESKIDKIIESDNKYYFEETVPKEYDFVFNEIGIFNKDDILLFYTKCSEVYKPYDVLFTVHYRVDKIL